MDNKKTNLTPELKEIYDRVMNTTAPQKVTSTPPPVQPNVPASTPLSPPVHTDIPNPLNAPPAAIPAMPLMPPSLNTSLGGTTPAENALSSTPARPVSEIDNKAFSFSGTAPTPPAVPQTDKAIGKKESKMSLPVLIVIGIVFLVVWGVFWAIIFGFIKR